MWSKYLLFWMKGYRSIILHIKPPELDHQKTSDYTTLCPGTEDNYWFPSQLTVCDMGEGRDCFNFLSFASSEATSFD